jgi:cytochrome c
MAGPVYYCDDHPAETRFPDYYHGKLITYDWMRGWMMAVTLDSLGNFSRMERFGDSISLSRPMDMLIDRNGSLWVLEYGVQWFAQNPDARLSRIDFVRGNRPPKPVLQADRLAGAAPCTVVFSAAGSCDYDGDRIDYKLDFGDGTPPYFLGHEKIRTLQAGLHRKTPRPALDSLAHTYAKPGRYEAVLTLTDTKGVSARTTIRVEVGNEPPTVFWDFGGYNRSFYQPGDTLRYRVAVEDREDGSLSAGAISPARVAVRCDYLETGFDITAIAQGHQTAQKTAEFARGKTLIEGADCGSCHATDRQINGPAYRAIAARYKNDDFAVRNLSLKIIKGGAGAWGQTVMSAHPQLSEADAGDMVRWILSLNAPEKPAQQMAWRGVRRLVPPDTTEKSGKKWPGVFIFQASYTDNGAGRAAARTGAQTLALRPAFLQAEAADGFSPGVTTYWPFKSDTAVLKDLKDGSHFLIRRADLHNVHTVAFGVGSSDKRHRFGGGRIELRLERPDGPLAGLVELAPTPVSADMQFREVRLPVRLPANYRPPAGQQGFVDAYFVLRNESAPSEQIAAIDWLRFDFLR